MLGWRSLALWTGLLTCLPAVAGAQDSAELAKKLSNPVASLISVPLQSNYDREIGPADDGWRYTLNVQPVIPISISEDWNLISRTILPVIYQADVANVRRSGEEVGQGSNQPGREVLVEQEPHAGGSAIRRRSRSAANARHARMSSGVRSGKSRRISSWDIPDAR
jgi:hypothetical protein